MLVVLVVPCLGIVCKIAVEKDLPTALEGWASPATVHAQDLGDWDQALGQRMSESTLAGLQARSTND
jgi:hypothetical protein